MNSGSTMESETDCLGPYQNSTVINFGEIIFLQCAKFTMINTKHSLRFYFFRDISSKPHNTFVLPLFKHERTEAQRGLIIFLKSNM